MTWHKRCCHFRLFWTQNGEGNQPISKKQKIRLEFFVASAWLCTVKTDKTRLEARCEVRKNDHFVFFQHLKPHFETISHSQVIFQNNKETSFSGDRDNFLLPREYWLIDYCMKGNCTSDNFSFSNVKITFSCEVKSLIITIRSIWCDVKQAESR